MDRALQSLDQPSKKTLTIGLVVQGGGNWGALEPTAMEMVLDYIERNGHTLAGSISTSAGTMNCTYAFDGWLSAGVGKRARAAGANMEKLWQQVATRAAPARAAAHLTDHAVRLREHQAGFFALQKQWLKAAGCHASVAQAFNMLQAMMDTPLLNPNFLDETFSAACRHSGQTHPLEAMVLADINFERLNRPGAPILLTSTVNVHTGKMAIHKEGGVTPASVAGSTTVARLFGNMSINDQDHWDGGFVANCPVIDLFKENKSITDLIVFRVTPFALRANETPSTLLEIEMREREMMMNSAMEGELRGLQVIAQLNGGTPRIHVIDLSQNGWHYPVTSKFDLRCTSHEFFKKAHAHGAKVTEDWFKRNGHKIGLESSYDPSPEVYDGCQQQLKNQAQPQRSAIKAPATLALGYAK